MHHLVNENRRRVSRGARLHPLRVDSLDHAVREHQDRVPRRVGYPVGGILRILERTDDGVTVAYFHHAVVPFGIIELIGMSGGYIGEVMIFKINHA